MKSKIKIPSTPLDQAINKYLPGWGVKRMKNRVILANASSYFDRPSRQRHFNDARPRPGDANANTLRDLPRLRNDSSGLVRTNPVAKSAIDINKNHIVGPGITYHSRINRHVLGMEVEEAREWQSVAEQEFKLATDTLDFAVDRKATFHDLQKLALGSYLERGDVFGLFVQKKLPNNPYTTKLELIEADRVCNPDGKRDTKNLIAGIEIKNDGEPVAIHVRTTHPFADINNVTRTWKRIPYFTKSGRRNVIHLNPITRPGQMRAVPYLSGIIGHLELLADYTDAELQAAVTAACFTVFITTETGQEGLAPMDENDPERDPNDRDYRIKPAALVEMKTGETMSTANPGRPNTAYGEFIVAILREVGAYLGIGRELLLIDFMKNFSASRAAVQTAYKRFFAEQAFFIRHFCAVVLDRIMEEAVIEVRIIAPGFDDPLLRQAYLGARWIGPAQTVLDEVKAAKAATERINNKTSPVADETATLGGDFDQNVPQLEREDEIFSKMSGGVGTGNIQPVPGQEEEEEEDKNE